MPVSEPILTAEDVKIWDIWMRTCGEHAKTRQHQERVDQAKRVVDEAVGKGRATVMWSGGKDSTAMAHLACVELGHGVPVASEKDDLDFPGEREYVASLAQKWGLDLTILTPPISPKQWIADHARELRAGDDMHSRAAGLSKACFYDLVEEWSRGFDVVLLGLRSGESRGRRLNRAVRGALYQKASGQWVGTPLADWQGIDVYAYCQARGVPLLDVYKCVALRDRDEPWRVRKSWWIPGSDARWGGVVWLRRYYPSLFQQLCQWMPDASLLG